MSAFSILLLFMIVHAGSSLKCYYYVSITGQAERGPELMECPKEFVDPVCIKVHGTASTANGTIEATVKQCVSKGACQEITFEPNTECSECNSDGCNSASRVLLTAAGPLLVASILLFLTHA